VDSLIVLRFDAPQVAEQAVPRLEALTRAGGAEVHDASLVSWPEAQRKPSTRDLGALTGPGMLWGGFWGVLLAVIFLTPLAGPTFGAAAGAVAGTLADFGVEDDFVKRVRDSVTPGTSALFLVAGGASVEAITAALAGLTVETIRSDLSHEQGRNLRHALGEESLHRIG
jgi:uncharacterized membrane protein